MKAKRTARLILWMVCLLVVFALPITTSAASIKMNKSSVNLVTGQTFKLKVSGTSKKITWVSNNKKVATVTSSGSVKAKAKGTVTVTATVKGSSKKYTCKVEVTNVPKITYQAHIQSNGWLSAVTTVDATSKTAVGKTAGTTGKSKRMEALKITLTNPNGSSMISYRAHVSNVGWQSWKKSGQIAGTTGQAKAIEAVQIKLSSEYAKSYDVYYRVHVANKGWLGWTKNGGTAGSTGLALQTEAIQIKIVKKKTTVATNGISALSKPTLTYKGYSESVGWQKNVNDGVTAGTTGQSKRLEALVINLKDFDGKNGIQYRAHVSNVGWQSWKNSGKTAGTTGEGKAIEAVQIKLSSTLSNYFDIYYRMHVAEYGWLGWAKNGATAGTTGGGIRAEAIQIKLVVKGSSFNTGGVAYVDASVSSSKTLNINWAHITQVGNQASRKWNGSKWVSSDSCACFTMAYSRTILDGRVHYWSEYNINPGNDQYNACASWSEAGYRKGYSSSQNEVFKKAYDSINNNRPFVVFVQGSRSSWHYITIVGYLGVTSTNTLSATNFLIIDSCPGTTTKNVENMGGVGYSLKWSSGRYEYIY